MIEIKQMKTRIKQKKIKSIRSNDITFKEDIKVSQSVSFL